MMKTFLQNFLIAVVLCSPAFLSLQARAEDPDLAYAISFTDEELDDLLAPIALYPDPLLAQLLPASTYPAEVADAAAWLDGGGDPSRLDEQAWDDSVKAMVRYPDLLRMMADDMDWTANLGDAFVNQPEAVADSIQRLRWRARAVGNLVSSDEQTVVIEGASIRIVPALAQYVYVPRYDAAVVYVEEPAPGFPPYITFGVSFIIGGWLDMDFDWVHRCVIYHGWDRPGWVDHARPFVHLRDAHNDPARPRVHRTWRHDGSRVGPARYLASRPGGRDAGRFRRPVAATVRGIVQPGSVSQTGTPEGRTSSYVNRGTKRRTTVIRRLEQPNAGIRQPAVSRRARPSSGVGVRGNSAVRRVNRQQTVAPRAVSPGGRSAAPAPERLQRQRSSSVSYHSAPGAGTAVSGVRGSRSAGRSIGQSRVSAPSRSSVRTPPGGKRDTADQQRLPR